MYFQSSVPFGYNAYIVPFGVFVAKYIMPFATAGDESIFPFAWKVQRIVPLSTSIQYSFPSLDPTYITPKAKAGVEIVPFIETFQTSFPVETFTA